MLFLLWVRYAFVGGKISAVEFDVKTVSAGDYTVEMKIPMESYKKWLKEFEASQGNHGKSTGLAFKEKIRHDVEALVAKHKEEVLDKEGGEKSVCDFEGP
jgi:hypothetical protein